jgi:hypothetical protein
VDLGDPIRIIEVDPASNPIPEPVELPAEEPRVPAEKPQEVEV